MGTAGLNTVNSMMKWNSVEKPILQQYGIHIQIIYS
jgi:hypothetical protein